uniref:VWFC domain-containing protein n=1 Tax=Amphiprion percula TaxID=161767 RepID=A0A3P8T357_AMPPE
EGSHWRPDGPCSSCTCVNGETICSQTRCPPTNFQCSHPVPSDSCCPVCNSCLYEGVVHSHGQTFTPLSNPCQRCTCVRGTATCVPHVCPPTPCARPVVRPGQCCPECPGCIYGGEEHAEGSSWFADSTPCMNCMCVDGVTTCSEVRCLSPCVNFINVPGECCPVCASCLYQGTVYPSNEQWEVDECTSCTCVSGDVHCRSERCPPLTCATVSSTSTHTGFLCVSSYLPRFVLSPLSSSSSHLHCLWRPSLPNLRWPHAALPGDVHVHPGSGLRRR